MRYPKTAGFGKCVSYPAEENLIVHISRSFFPTAILCLIGRKDFFFFADRFKIHVGGETKCPVILFSHKSRQSLQTLLNS